MNKAELIQLMAEGNDVDFLFFFGHQASKDGKITKSCLSQWWLSTIVVDGYWYATAEHWMMACKARLFHDEAALKKILGTTDPRIAKAIGKTIQGYNEEKWVAARYKYVVEGNTHKFHQHPDLRKFLLGSGDRVLVEASPYDRIWGIGINDRHENATAPRYWPGQNLLGFALMDVREQLRK